MADFNYVDKERIAELERYVRVLEIEIKELQKQIIELTIVA